MTKRSVTALRLPSSSKLTILPWVSRFFNFCHDKTPNLVVLVKYHSEMKSFFVQWKRKCLPLLNRNWFSLCIKTPKIAICTTPLARVSRPFSETLCRPYVLQMRLNELKYGFYRQNHVSKSKIMFSSNFSFNSSKIKLYQPQTASTGRISWATKLLNLTCMLNICCRCAIDNALPYHGRGLAFDSRRRPWNDFFFSFFLVVLFCFLLKEHIFIFWLT